MSQNHPISKEEILKLIEYFEKPLEFYEDPVYTTQEKEAIKKFEHLAFEFYKSLKKDGYITFSERDKKEEKMVAIFTKIIVDISNKLARTTEFNAEEGWFILLSLYCWVCEMIKNSLSDVAIKIYRNLESREWKGFMTMAPFVKTMSRYKNRKYAFLFSEMDVDLKIWLNNNLVLVGEVLNWSIGSRMSIKRCSKIVSNLSEYNCHRVLIHTVPLNRRQWLKIRGNGPDTLKIGYQILPKAFYDFYRIMKRITKRKFDNKKTKADVTLKISKYLRKKNI